MLWFVILSPIKSGLTGKEKPVLYLLSDEKKRQVQDSKFEKKIRYFQLIVDRFAVENDLWHEYPKEMTDSTIALAEKLLKTGLIKCKHEQGTKRK